MAGSLSTATTQFLQRGGRSYGVARLRRPARDTGDRRRSVAVAIGVGVVAILVAGGLAFANAVAASQVANNARALHWTNAALGTSALAHAALGQVVIYNDLATLDLVGRDDSGAARAEFATLVQRNHDLVDMYWGGESVAVVTAFDSALDEALAAVVRNDDEAVRRSLTEDVGPVLTALQASLSAEQAGIVDRIDDTEAIAGRVAGGVRFLVSLLIPAIAVLAYRVTARRQVRALQVEADLRVEAAEAISRAKDDFAASLSHELRTPLTSIYGFAEVLADRPDDPAMAAELATTISVEAANLTRMVDDVLAASRLEQLGVAVASAQLCWDELVADVLRRFSRENLNVTVLGGGCPVYGDRGWLRQALTNVVSNAHRHGGPTIEIETGVEADRSYCIVRDDGAGVPDEHLRRLFDMYAHDGAAPLLAGSVGLGLGVASRVIAAMGGELRYERSGAWTEFTIVMPATAAPEEEAADHPGVSRSAAG